jgi:hypothetical protein
MQLLRHKEDLLLDQWHSSFREVNIDEVLCKNKTKQDAFHVWAGARELITYSLFFWNLGHTLQKSQEGIFRSILYSVLKEYQSLIAEVLSGFYNNVFNYLGVSYVDEFDPAPMFPPLKSVEIKLAFYRLIKHIVTLDLKLCTSLTT